MESLKEHAIPVISVLVALACVGFDFIRRTIVNTLKKHDEKLDEYQKQHFECQAALPARFAGVELIHSLIGKVDRINESLSTMPLVYRTKEEANKDWMILEKRLTELHGSINNLGSTLGDRHRELWDKINRVVASFMFLTQLTFDRVSQIECRIPSDTDQERLNKMRDRINKAMEELKVEQINGEARADVQRKEAGL